jgi:hypothetical protein
VFIIIIIIIIIYLYSTKRIDQIGGVKNDGEKLQSIAYFCSTDRIKINAKIVPHEDYFEEIHFHRLSTWNSNAEIRILTNEEQ